MRGLPSLLERDEGRDGLTFEVVGTAHNRSFGDRFVGDESGFDFHRAEAMTADVEYIVDAAHDPEISILVSAGTVAGEVHVFEGAKVGVDEAVVIAPGGAHDAGPRVFDAEFPAFIGFAFGAVIAEDDGLDAEEGTVGAAGF